jgi:hypothetical protein
MTTTGHIVKAHRDINGERGLMDFPTHVVDVVGVGAGVYDRLAELGVPVTRLCDLDRATWVVVVRRA